MGRQFDGLALKVKDPAKDDLSGAPTCVALAYLLERGCFVLIDVSGCGLIQNLVDGVEQVVSLGVQSSLAALSELDEVVHEYIGVIDGSVQATVRGG